MKDLTISPSNIDLQKAFFWLNALISVNNTSPYNALYGRVPNILPDINVAGDVDETGSRPGLLRHSARLREIAVSRIVEGTAKARTDRMLKTRTLPAGQIEQYEIGDEVEFYRPPSSKDVKGWNGPARIASTLDIDRGTIGIKWQGRTLECRLGDVRR